MHDQGVKLAVSLSVEMVYWQQVVTTVGKTKKLAFESAIWGSAA